MRRFVGISPIAISAVPLQRARESEKLDVSANSMIWSELEFEFRRRSVGEIATKVAIVCDHWLAVDADFAGQPNDCSRQSIALARAKGFIFLSIEDETGTLKIDMIAPDLCTVIPGRNAKQIPAGRRRVTEPGQCHSGEAHSSRTFLTAN